MLIICEVGAVSTDPYFDGTLSRNNQKLKMMEGRSVRDQGMDTVFRFTKLVSMPPDGFLVRRPRHREHTSVTQLGLRPTERPRVLPYAYAPIAPQM